jgi:hypothetical protein
VDVATIEYVWNASANTYEWTGSITFTDSLSVSSDPMVEDGFNVETMGTYAGLGFFGGVDSIGNFIFYGTGGENTAGCSPTWFQWTSYAYESGAYPIPTLLNEPFIFIAKTTPW